MNIYLYFYIGNSAIVHTFAFHCFWKNNWSAQPDFVLGFYIQVRISRLLPYLLCIFLKRMWGVLYPRIIAMTMRFAIKNAKIPKVTPEPILDVGLIPLIRPGRSFPNTTKFLQYEVVCMSHTERTDLKSRLMICSNYLDMWRVM